MLRLVLAGKPFAVVGLFICVTFQPTVVGHLAILLFFYLFVLRCREERWRAATGKFYRCCFLLRSAQWKVPMRFITGCACWARRSEWISLRMRSMSSTTLTSAAEPRRLPLLTRILKPAVPWRTSMVNWWRNPRVNSVILARRVTDAWTGEPCSHDLPCSRWLEAVCERFIVFGSWVQRGWVGLNSDESTFGWE